MRSFVHVPARTTAAGAAMAGAVSTDVKPARPPGPRPRAIHPGDLVDASTRRRAGVFRRAIRREVSRLHERRRIIAIVALAVVGGVLVAGLWGRGEAAGADARAYWAGARIWLAGGDPYHPTGPFLPYVYAPWLLPLFTPWALLPWDVAWFAWRGASILALLWTVDWAYRRRPIATAVVLTLLAFPIAANLDTGNLTLVLAFMLWAAQFVGPRLSGLLWALATWAKWVPAPAWLILQPRGRAWGLVWLGLAVLLSLATLPLTIVQLETLFGFGRRPIRLDYLVLLWAAVPWVWRHPDPLWWLHPREWPAARARAAAALSRGTAAFRAWAGTLRREPDVAAATARREVAARVRQFLGLGA